MANRILTTHVGSLPRPQKLLDVSQKRTLGQKFDEAEFEKVLKDCRRSTWSACRKRSASISSTTASSATPWAGPTTTAPGGRT